MIFTRVHQLFLHEHGSSVFTGNKVTKFKSRSLGLEPGEDVRMGAVVHLHPISLGMWACHQEENLPSPLRALCSSHKRQALPEKLVALSWQMCPLLASWECQNASSVIGDVKGMTWAHCHRCLEWDHGLIACELPHSSMTAAPPGHYTTPDLSTLCCCQILFYIYLGIYLY